MNDLGSTDLTMCSPDVFHRFSISQEGLSFFGQVCLVRIRKRDGLDVTEANTLRVSVTVIALHRHPLLGIEERMAKGAGNDAGSTSDAKLFVDGHPVIVFRLPVAGLCRAYLHAVGFLTMIAGHGEIKPYILPLDHFHPGAAWIACSRMKHRAHQFAQTASGALLLIDNQYLFFLHHCPPALSKRLAHRACLRRGGYEQAGIAQSEYLHHINSASRIPYSAIHYAHSHRISWVSSLFSPRKTFALSAIMLYWISIKRCIGICSLMPA